MAPLHLLRALTATRGSTGHRAHRVLTGSLRALLLLAALTRLLALVLLTAHDITIVTSDSSGNSADRPFTVAVL
ncbi:hypothetical protein [Streptomyces sp. Isolate_45]|uniref:hypothetical protein n=1 Tax=Streptomyces sp. Isolate_45 TaxID=2950111 RepID=UPI002481A13F|nr:hypothetical protein [Streptomyces sp. Isolate_45]MDA5284102.1 hypothetical protein [Streptomyces sp. Isolate_45]